MVDILEEFQKEVVEKTPKKNWEDLRIDLADWHPQCPRGTMEFITMADVLMGDLKWIKTKTQETFDLDIGQELHLLTTSYHLGRPLELGLCSGTGLDDNWATYDVCDTVEFDNICKESS